MALAAAAVGTRREPRRVFNPHVHRRGAPGRRSRGQGGGSRGRGLTELWTTPGLRANTCVVASDRHVFLPRLCLFPARRLRLPRRCRCRVRFNFVSSDLAVAGREIAAKTRQRRDKGATVRDDARARHHRGIGIYAPGLSVGTLPPSRLVFLCAVRMARAHVSSPDIACVSAGRCIIHTEFLPRDAHSPSRRLGSTQGGQKPTYFARTPRRIAGRRRSPLERWRRRRSRQGLNGHCRRPRRHPS